MNRPSHATPLTVASPTGETPWLLFVGILMMALVPAMFAQQKLREFDERLEGGAGEVRLRQAQLKELDKTQQHILHTVLPDVGRRVHAAEVSVNRVDHMAEKTDRVGARLDAVDDRLERLATVLDQLDKEGHSVAKDQDDLKARLQALEDAGVVSRGDFERFLKQRADLLKAQAKAEEEQRKATNGQLNGIRETLSKAMVKTYEKAFAKVKEQDAKLAALEKGLAALKAKAEAGGEDAGKAERAAMAKELAALRKANEAQAADLVKLKQAIVKLTAELAKLAAAQAESSK